MTNVHAAASRANGPIAPEPSSAANPAPERRRRVMDLSAPFLGAVALVAALAAATTAAAQPAPPAAPSAIPGPAAYPGGMWSPGRARFGVASASDVPITMDDGTVLRATVLYPADKTTGQRVPGRFPVILEHTPYVATVAAPPTFFTARGYIYVAAQARGTGRSGGELQRFTPRDAQDGLALVNWAAHRLDGADGRIGLYGCSYPGVMALNTAARLKPGSPVKAIVAACAGLSLNRATMMVGGMPTTSFWNFIPRGASSMGNTPAAVRFFAAMEASMKAGGDVAYEGAFWLQRGNIGLTRQIAQTGIPVLQWAGWRDTNNAVALRTFAALQNVAAGRPWGAPLQAGRPLSPRYQILMSNGEHGQDLDDGVILQWFETWLGGVDTGIARTRKPIHLFEPGTDRWINLARFPAPARYTDWQLAPGALLRRAAKASSQTIAFGDPAARLTYTTAPLPRGATLSGPISATVLARSSNTNLRLIAKLYDVAPGGTATLFSTGVVLGSQHTPDPALSWKDASGTLIWPWPRLDADTPLQPGRTYRLEIPFEPQQRALLPGHNLRLELTTSVPEAVCPAAAVPPPNNNDVCRMTGPQAASLPGGIYTILTGPGTSALHLPQLPLKAQPTVASGPAPTPQHAGERSTIPLDWGR